MKKLDLILNEELKIIKDKGLYRHLRSINTVASPEIEVEGKKMLLFCSNNYLGINSHPKVISAKIKAVKEYGTGCGASRLISGNIKLYEELEQRLAQFKKTETALVYASGYMANVGVISSLATKEDLILSDELNHASIIDGCRQSRAKIVVYPHNDIEKLEETLRKGEGNFRCKFVISDGIFSMDGDLASLPQLINICKKYGAYLIIDDAHATGVLGKAGRGTAEYFNCEGKIDVQTGSLSKALGGVGGFVCGSKTLKEYLINCSRSLIYSTALPPASLASALAALKVIEEEKQLLERLKQNAVYLREGLQSLGFTTNDTNTPIIPIFIGDLQKTMEYASEIISQGIYAVGIRPPTVPEGKCRIRLSVMATHKKEHLNYALKVLEKAGKKLRII